MAFPKTRNKYGHAVSDSVGDLCGTYMTYMKSKATSRKLEWSVTKEYLWNLFEQQRGRCALSDVPLKMSTKINEKHNLDRTEHTASLDRINNDVGYVEGNVQWVHKQINRIRRELTVGEFMFWCHLVHHANPEPSSSNDIKVDEKVQRLMGEESTNNPNTSVQPHTVGDDIV